MTTTISPSDVLVLESPWSGGRTIESYWGPVGIVVRVPHEPRATWEERVLEGIDDAFGKVRADAARLGANAICSPALDVDPFGQEVEISFRASAFQLRGTPKWSEFTAFSWPHSGLDQVMP